MDKCIKASQKNQIEDIIKLLEKAHSAVINAVETGNQEAALTLLEQCQDSAIQIGNLIEESMGEGFITIGMLESYCEQVYQVYELVRQQQSINIGKMYKNLRRELIRIANSVKNDIKVKTVAVFLPYKASMWDSLESVWQAADADPDCDAYVVPIPYYDKNPDGSFKEMHYEGGEYPDYVPIVSWEEYNLAAEHPDVIFIHNPYDEFNLITSVPPEYYSKELRECTDKLVYIPYFVLEEIEPDNKEAVEGIEHFCAVPAVAYADSVIVQSEKMRQIYINVMSKSMGEDTRKVWEKKILGLGSPKIDRVLKTRKDGLDIPEEWLRIIRKPDGNWKKILFYNTSVSALLQYNEEMLDKMEYVFSIFKESKDEVALLWRPHPLIKATIESMRPQLWEEYDKLVTKYQEEGWGIYDDTADVDRAIAISDAYYGDHSSIVHMYKQTGKPIMIQDVQILRTGRYKYNIAATEAICNYQGNYYFTLLEDPVLCKMNQETLECELIYLFKERCARLYRKIFSYQNRLFLIPYFSDQIAVYDLASQEMQFIMLNENYVDIRDSKWSISSKFQDILIQGKFLYMIPERYHALVKMDMEDLTLEEIPLGKKGTEVFYYCMGSACMQKNQIVFPIYSEGSVCVFDADTNEIERVYPLGNKKKYSNIFSIGNELWLIPMKIYEGIDIWDINHRMIKETLIFSDEINDMSRKNQGMDFRAGFLIGQRLYLLSCGLESSMIINLDSKTADIWNLPNIYEKDEFPPYRYRIRHASVFFKDERTVICGLRGEWLECEGSKTHIIERQAVWNRDLMSVLSTGKLREVIPECRLDLTDFVKMKAESEETNMDIRVNNGQSIYKYMCRQDRN